MNFKTYKNDSKTWIGYSREELTTTWLGLVAYRRSLESDLRKHMVKPSLATVDRDALMEQTEMYGELTKVTRMLAQLSEIISKVDILEGASNEAE